MFTYSLLSLRLQFALTQWTNTEVQRLRDILGKRHVLLLLFSLLSHVRLLRPHGLQHARLSCPSLSPGICSDSCPLSRWCHPNISFSVAPFSSYPWTARRSNLSILKEINPEYLLEGLMLKLKLQYFAHLIQRADSLEKTLKLGETEVKRQVWKLLFILKGTLRLCVFCVWGVMSIQYAEETWFCRISISQSEWKHCHFKVWHCDN